VDGLQPNLSKLLRQRVKHLIAHCTGIERLHKQSDAMTTAGAITPDTSPKANASQLEQVDKLYDQCQQFLNKLDSINGDVDRTRGQVRGVQSELQQWLPWIIEHFFKGTRREQIASLEGQLAELYQQATTVQQKLGKGLAYQKLQTQRLLKLSTTQFDQDTNAVGAYLSQLESAAVAGWNQSSAWSQWEPPQGVQHPQQVRVGEFVEEPAEVFGQHLGSANLDSNRLLSSLGPLSPVVLPAYLPFVGSDQCYIVQSDDSTAEDAVAFLNSIILRISTLLPNQSRFTLIDPSGHGRSFPLRRLLQDVRESEEQVYSELREVIRDIRRINEDVLGLVEKFEDLPDEARASEKFEFVFAADFPNGYDRRAIDELFNIATTGTRAGRYVFIHLNSAHPLPRDVSIEQLKNATQLTPHQHPQVPAGYSYRADGLPPQQTIQDILAKVEDSAPPEHALVWENVAALPSRQWWQESSEKIIETPVGGSQQEMEIWFGVNEEGRPCAHGMLGAMTGSGKSNLYHVLIMGLSIRYSPEQLQLYLIDGKDGVEFQPYQDLPHAAVVSLKSSPALSRSVLTELLEEKERRNALFAAENVRDFSAYRAKGHTLPRILLLIDEYQELFENDPNGEASASLLQIAQQGRSAGIHMLLGSQQFGAPGMLNQSAILGNVHLRMAMKMDYSKVQALTEFGPRGKSLIRSCDLPGKIVVNDKTGEDSGNTYGKVALISTDEQNELVGELSDFAKSQGQTRQPIVFHGAAQPKIIEHPAIRRFAAQPAPSLADIEKIARKPVAESGFGIQDWTTSEKPLAAWVGQEFNVRGGSPVAIRRTYSHNAAIIGSNKSCREGILAGIICSAASLLGNDHIQFAFYDRSLAADSVPPTPRLLHENLLSPGGFTSTYYASESDAEVFITSLEAEMAARKSAADEGREAPSILAVINEPNRSSSLRRSSSRFSKESNQLLEKLLFLLTDGPQHGIHIIALAGGVKLLGHTFDERRDFEFFNHRFALQMSEDDSFAFVGNRRASQLQKDAPVPVVALYSNNEAGTAIRFKPFSIESEVDAIGQLREQLARRMKLVPQQ
jgi:S-DNA-T family DNA segregation ATPase FtsK/SpoIIIE